VTAEPVVRTLTTIIYVVARIERYEPVLSQHFNIREAGSAPRQQ
jgi:hypothetical protein